MSAFKVPSGPNVKLLQESVKKIPKFKAVMEYFAEERGGKSGEPRGSQFTTFPTLRRKPQMRAIGLVPADMTAIFKALQEAKAGALVYDDKGYYKFIWVHHLIDVAHAALGRKLPEGDFRSPVYRRNAHLPSMEELEKVAATALTLRAATAKPALSAVIRRPAAVPTPAPTSTLSDGTQMIIVRGEVNGRPAEFELDMSKVPAEALKLVKML
jgi:hypothetical protein